MEGQTDFFRRLYTRAFCPWHPYCFERYFRQLLNQHQIRATVGPVEARSSQVLDCPIGRGLERAFEAIHCEYVEACSSACYRFSTKLAAHKERRYGTRQVRTRRAPACLRLAFTLTTVLPSPSVRNPNRPVSMASMRRLWNSISSPWHRSFSRLHPMLHCGDTVPSGHVTAWPEIAFIVNSTETELKSLAASGRVRGSFCRLSCNYRGALRTREEEINLDQLSSRAKLRIKIRGEYSLSADVEVLRVESVYLKCHILSATA
jgi:hypothetical protein